MQISSHTQNRLNLIWKPFYEILYRRKGFTRKFLVKRKQIYIRLRIFFLFKIDLFKKGRCFETKHL